jgi:tetratricopeptide (TPR) repeat protein
MNDAGKAVFLSYASQDSDAAKRICEALRHAGVEVWFDQNELRGGDAWDAAIRRQIKECTLFVPVISANTQSRAEGYFRLEWRLAVDRSHLMADDAPFLFPIVIGDVSEPAARVPDKFRERQWTRLDPGQSTDALVQRIVSVLAGDSRSRSPQASAPSTPPRAIASRVRPRVPVWAWVLGGIGVAVLVAFAAFRSRSPEDSTVAPAARTEAARPATAADKLVERATAILDGSALSREQIDAANGLLEQAIALEPTNGAAWTAAARGDLMVIHPYGYDRSDERRQRAMSRAARALNLAPDSFETRVVHTAVMAHASGNPDLAREAEEAFRRMIKERPEDTALQVRLAEVLREERRFEEAASTFAQIEEFELAAWSLLQAGKYAAAYEHVRRAVVDRRTTTALLLKGTIETAWFQDLAAAQATVAEFRPSELREQLGATFAIQLAFERREPERMLQVVNALSHDFMDSNAYVGPRQFWAGWAHRLGGRSERATIEWRKAIPILQAERAKAPERIVLLDREAEIQALLGEREEAALLLAIAQRVANEPPDVVNLRNHRVHLALGHREQVLIWLTSFLQEKANVAWVEIHTLARFSPIWDGLRDDARFEALLRETMPADAKPFPAP